MKHKIISLLLVSAFALPNTALATTSFSAILNPLNNSGVNGLVNMTLDGNILKVNLLATGLEPNQEHVAHIHGRLDANNMPIDSTIPTLAQDTDRDGFIELAEGEATYGPILLQLTNPPGNVDGSHGNGHTGSGFSTAPLGQINYSETFDLSQQSNFGTTFTAEELLPLQLREIVVHGLTVGNIGAGTPGEVDGMAGFKTVLPVSAGSIFQVSPIPEPETYAMLLAGLGLLGAVARRRKANGSGV
ncbi:MAG: PEP-CTERM sorting domain-containing protein [Pseudomonadota bacterium]|nr:PEP-CTERM sorting domain-containing protein [Pseudomonadota bacterium]